MSQNYMSISKEEMLRLLEELEDNSENLYNDAVIVSKRSSYGTATSLLIQSLEESMKFSILLMDYHGFQFRHKVKGIKSVFTNHSMRYGIGMILTLFHVLALDIQKGFETFRKSPKETLAMMKNKSYREQFLSGFIKQKLLEFQKESEWYAKAEYLRQSGFYVDYKGGLKSPLQISEQDYKDVLIRMGGVRSILELFKEAFQEHAMNPDKNIIEIQHNFIKEGYYELLGGVTEMFGRGMPNPLLLLSGNLKVLSRELETNFKEEE